MKKNEFRGILEEFWDTFCSLRQEDDKIKLLMNYSEFIYKRRKNVEGKRKRFVERMTDGRKQKRKMSTCYICNSYPVYYHHIISLINGGNNSTRNLILICRGCHEKIHPWMQKGYRDLLYAAQELDKEFSMIVKEDCD